MTDLKFLNEENEEFISSVSWHFISIMGFDVEAAAKAALESLALARPMDALALTEDAWFSVVVRIVKGKVERERQIEKMTRTFRPQNFPPRSKGYYGKKDWSDFFLAARKKRKGK
mgnify:CR=1 FL=1|jgi:hypothetical protein